MRYALLAVTIVLAATIAAAVPQPQASPRKIPCKTPENASLCIWTRGRIQLGNGTPSYRLWKVGTTRLLGIYSGPSVDRDSLDNEDPEFPANVQRVWQDRIGRTLWADFEVCPLERERTGFMQASCVESAQNIFIQDWTKILRDSHP
jgi:hypothetical protein